MGRSILFSMVLLMVAGGLWTARGQDAKGAPTQEAKEDVVCAQLAARHIAALNETNLAKERELLKSVYAADVTVVDPYFSAHGRRLLAAEYHHLHELFPGYVFTLVGTPKVHDGVAEIHWKQGEPNQPGVYRGEDFVVIRKGRIRSVRVVVDGAGR